MKSPTRFALWLVPALVVALGLSACDSSTPTGDESVLEVSTTEDFTATLTSDLALTSSQQAQVVSLMARFNREDHEPGYLWRVAEQLQQTLTEEQKEKLFTMAADGPGYGPNSQHRRTGFRSGGLLGVRNRLNGGNPNHGFLGRAGRGGGALFELLTDEQKEQVQAIRESYREQLDAIRASVEAGELTREEARSQVQEIFAAMRAEIEALLTEEQKAALEALRAERHAERAARHEEGKAVRNEVLGLSDEEAAAFDEIVSALREERQTIREQVRAGELSFEEAQQARLALMNQRYEDLGAILDETQLEIVRIHDAIALRARHHGMHGGHGWNRAGGGSGFGGFGARFSGRG